jgi:hypothetical protein
MADRHVAVLRKLFAKEVIGEVGSPLFSAFWRAVVESRVVDVSQELPVSKRGKEELVHALHFVEDALGLGSDAHKRFMSNEYALNRVAVPELEAAVASAACVVLPPGKSSHKRPRPPIRVVVESGAVGGSIGSIGHFDQLTASMTPYACCSASFVYPPPSPFNDWSLIACAQ